MTSPLLAPEFRAMLDAVPGFVLFTDTERRIRFLSREPLRGGIQRFIGRDFATCVPASQQRLVRTAFERILDNELLVELEAQGDETEHWYKIRITPIREQGEVRGMAVHMLDIDDLKRNEFERARLRASLRAAPAGRRGDEEDSLQYRFEMMADALEMPVSYVGRNLCYGYNNAAYERWFGTPREELTGMPLPEVLGQAAWTNIRPYVEAVLQGRSVAFEMAIPYHKAGERHVRARYVPDIAADGEVRGFFALIEDVTERRRSEALMRQREDELRQHQKMEALGRLAGGVAHEFNNLLQVIGGSCDMLRGLCEDGSEQARQADRLLSATRRGAALTRQLLDFSRREAPQAAAAPLDLDPLLHDMVMLLRPLLGSGVRLQADLHAACRVFGDAGQIQQIVMNLAINARDAMPEGGELRIATGRRMLGEETARGLGLSAGPHVEISVADTGRGMDRRTRERIFEPFFTTKPSGQGTGLGLPTVFGLVQNMKGAIQVRSEPGRGTTFQLLFPCARPAVMQEAESLARSSGAE